MRRTDLARARLHLASEARISGSTGSNDYGGQDIYNHIHLHWRVSRVIVCARSNNVEIGITTGWKTRSGMPSRHCCLCTGTSKSSSDAGFGTGNADRFI